MRICIVNPPRIQPKVWGKPNVFPPINIATIAAVLEKTHEVWIIDAPTEGWKNLEEIEENRYRVGLSNEEIGEKFRLKTPEIVIIEIPFSGWSRTAFEVASIAKNNCNAITIIFGQHPSARPIACLSNSQIDFVVIGEPENTLLELVNVIEQGSGDFDRINGIGFFKNGQHVIAPPRPPIQDLDSLPFPARHLLPMDVYNKVVKENPLRGEIRKPWTIIITSRGCPHSCIFCSNCIVWGKKWRARSPKNVIDEMKQVIEEFHIEQIDFADENMTHDPVRMEAICDAIIKNRLRVEWFTPNGIRADTLSERLLKKMKKAGCKKIRLAPESGVQRVVDKIIKKNLDLKTVEKAVILCKKIGIKVGCFFVIGLIGETKEDIEKTIQFAYKLRKLGADSFIFSIATPLYGTELYEQAKRSGFLREGFCDDALAAIEPLIETPEFSAEDLRELCARANLVNRSFIRAKIFKAIRDPKRAFRMLIEK